MASSLDKDSDECIVNNQTFDKLRENARKSGYRDGISDARDANFQSSFDKGYEEGFKNGFSLGLYKGILSTNTGNFPTELEKTSHGNCIICKDKSLEEKSIPQLITLQSDDTNIILSQLKNKYQIETCIDLPDKLE